MCIHICKYSTYVGASTLHRGPTVPDGSSPNGSTLCWLPCREMALPWTSIHVGVTGAPCPIPYGPVLMLLFAAQELDFEPPYFVHCFSSSREFIGAKVGVTGAPIRRKRSACTLNFPQHLADLTTQSACCSRPQRSIVPTAGPSCELLSCGRVPFLDGGHAGPFSRYGQA